MRISADHLKRYREIARLLWKYGRSDLAQHLSQAEGFDLPEMNTADALPAELADDLEALGPTFVKLGQVLSSRPDLLPEPYLKALARLQDRVKPFPASEVEPIILAELGVRVSKAFSRFDPEPVAAASLGQVHFAALRDGRPVVVKVQRPEIRRQIAEDFEVLAQIAGFLDAYTEFGRRYRFLSVLEEFRLTIQQELNYEDEAQNLIAIRKNLREFDLIEIPQPVLDYCSRSVLTMDHVRGRKITSLSPLDRLEINGRPLVEAIFQAYLKQVLIDGLFHADPHPGNVFITDDGRIALLDLGMVGHTGPAMQENLFKLLLAVSEGNGDEAAELVIRMSGKRDGFEPIEFRHHIGQLVARRRDHGLQELRVGKSLLEVSRHARDSGLFVPGELALLGKTLLQLDEIGRILDPGFDPNAVIRRNVLELTSRHMRKDLRRGNIFASLLEIKSFVGRLPARLNRIMDAAANAELEIKVRTPEAQTVMDGMQKIANRITAGIVLAALIIGASLLMRIPTEYQLFGYPALAIIFFLAAAAGGFWLVISIFLHDSRSRKKHP